MLFLILLKCFAVVVCYGAWRQISPYIFTANPAPAADHRVWEDWMNEEERPELLENGQLRFKGVLYVQAPLVMTTNS